MAEINITSSDTAQPSAEIDPVLLVRLIASVEEMQHMLKENRPNNETKLVEMIVERLVSNDTFIKRLAATMVQVTKEIRDRHQEQSAVKDICLVDIIPGVRTAFQLAPPLQPVEQEDGTWANLESTGEIQIQAGYLAFEGATHTGTIAETALNDKQELGIVTVHVSDPNTGVQYALNGTSEQGRSLLNTLNSSMQYLIESGRKSPHEFAAGAAFWFNAKQVTFVKHDQIENAPIVNIPESPSSDVTTIEA